MAENGTEDYEIPEVGAIANTISYFPEDEVIKNELGKLRASNTTYQAALREVQSRNLQVRDDEGSAPYGWTTVDQSVLGDQVKATTIIQSLGSDGEKDYGLMFFTAQGIEDGRLVYETHGELVEKPSAGVADPSDIKTVALFQDGAKVAGDIQRRSLLSRFTKCLRSGCSSACLGSITTCAGAFPVYLKCVIVKCGGCAVKCGACAACNCRFWCKWAAGCCKD